MAKFFGDLPCVNLNGTIHLTVSATSCACGHLWSYGVPTSTEQIQQYGAPYRAGRRHNIIWRTQDAITCPNCLKTLTEP